MLISLILTSVIGVLFIKFNVYKYTCHKYHKLKRLYNLVSTRHKSSLIISIISIKMLLQAFYLNFIQYMNNSIIKLDKNTYILSYILHDKEYKMIVKIARGPSPILNIKNEDDKDLTDIIIPYLGPKNDWHNYKFTPKFFDCKSLSFELLNGETIKFFDETEIQKF